MSGESNRRINNPLFNPNVTGGTYEDFSQNAVLFPAPVQVPTPPNHSVSTASESTLQTIVDTNSNVQHQQETIYYQAEPLKQNLSYHPQELVDNQSVPPTFESYNINPPAWDTQNSNLNHQPDLTQNYQESSSQLSSIISSFSNIWKRNPNSNSPPLQEQQQVSSGIATYFEPNLDAPPVPLFSPRDVNLNPGTAPTTETGNKNTYRRAGSKKPSYAQIPGLSSSVPPPLSSSVPQQISNQPASHHQPAPSFASPNYFKPELSGYSSPSNTSATDLTKVTTTPSTFSAELFKEPPQSINFSTTPLFPTPPVTSQHSVQSSFQHSLTSPFLEPIVSSSPFLEPIVTSSPFLEPIVTSPFLIPVTTLADLNTSTGLLTTYSTGPIMATMPASDVPNLPGPNNPPNTPFDQTDGVPQVNQRVTSTVYRPVYHHWFFKREVENRVIWKPFSMIDSLALENAFTSPDLSPETVVATDGGRFDVNILRRERNSVYWKSDPNEVRRCSWFHKGHTDGKYIPYDENIAAKLEEEYKTAFELNQWHKKVELPNGESVMLHGPDVLALFPPTQSPDAWGNTPQSQARPRLVKRGMDEFDVDEGESSNVDHLLFMVHGIGPVCDLKFRSVEEVVDEFRSISLQLIQSHYRSSCEQGKATRIEVLPVSWHDHLHSEDTGIDNTLKSITLESIPKLRDFTNNTLLDILFYTSPVYSQTIISAVGNELNRILELFRERNPNFEGEISLAGHSLGSLILFDILCHQHPEPEKEEVADSSEDVVAPLQKCRRAPKLKQISRRISYMMSTVGTGQPQLTYPHLGFQPVNFFALGSPIGMFVAVRGLDTLGEQFSLPTCPGFYNIFHPYDPVAYRIESLINPQLCVLKPVLIPHHKGRKRMHLELKETMTRVGTDLKQKVIATMKSTWNSLFQVGLFNNNRPQDTSSLEAEMNKVLEQELAKEQNEVKDTEEPVEAEPTDLCLGSLNKGRRVDYVLQEAPFEFFNEYIFALTSHVCYWESEDTILLILKEIYDSMDITTDNQIPQQTMTIERLPPSPKSSRTPSNQQGSIGMDPTAPIASNTNLGPPPMFGFVKKT